MKVIKKHDIFQIEDWSENFQNHPYVVGCYPTVTKKPCCDNWHKIDERIRITLKFKNEEEAEKAFAALTAGEKGIKDFSEFVHNPKHLDYID